MAIKRFDPLTMPLDGIRLVEASAGTGKTFSLAGLYLRLLLEKQVSVREILVVTFTRAATEELRERIRQRLAAAARIARDPDRADPESTEDAYVESLIEASGREREYAVRCWGEAAHRMDEATITTIHGFSQRAGAENAFDSALAFDRGEQVDDHDVYGEAVEDYWRAHALGNAVQPGFTEWWPSPGDLAADLAPLWLKPHAVLAGPDDPQIRKLARNVRKLWAQSGDELSGGLEAAWEEGALKKEVLYRALEACGGPQEALAVLTRRLDSDEPIPAPPPWTFHLADASAQFKQKHREVGETLFGSPLAQALCRLAPLGKLAGLRAAHGQIRETAAKRKRDRRQYSYADMIEALHTAVTAPETGPRLADALRQTWPWALVDEFQDTDPLQYEILQRVYGNRDRGGLILIGDPKQAIYGFRGGDVFAYLRAASDAGEAVYGLDTNFRSTPGLLEAFECLFRAPGDGAFLVEGIEFQSVKPGRHGERELRFAGESVAPMTLWHLAPGKPTKGPTHQACLDACVARIREYLDPNSGAIVRETADDADEVVDRPLRPRDVAVLVNTNNEASDVQRALARAGIAAVCLHQQSVLGTDEASDLLRVLKAAADPVDEGAIRGALVGELLGYRLNDMMALHEDQERWQDEIERFQQHHARWRADGVLAMLEPLIQGAAERLLTYEDGERRVSNYLQLAEILAGAEEETFGMAGLLRWLRTKTREAGAGQGDEAEQLRLESDEALVRIATVHKAKGLEYPLVFLPFAPWLGSTAKADQLPLELHDHNGRALLDVVGVTDSLEPAVREKRSEALRTLYVAVTRAELGCFLPWCAANGTANSALASLLHRDDGIGPGFWTSNRTTRPLDNTVTRKRLEALAERAPDAIVVEDMGESIRGITRLQPGTAPGGHARDDLPMPRTPWSIQSFSGLVHLADIGPATGGAADEGAAADRTVETPGKTLLELPGGTDFGTAVHELLETVDFAQWPSPEQCPKITQLESVERSLRQHGVALPEGDQGARAVEQTHQLICNAVHTPIPELGPLASIDRGDYLAEMEFVLHLHGATLGKMLGTLREAGYAIDLPRDRQALLLNGLMHGFIDLTVQSGGRFYVIDYKTNWLGPDLADYSDAGMREAVRHHRYDLQYLIYMTALHRYLGTRIPEYDPEQHLGGVYYLFLRGMRPDAGQSGIFADRPDPTLIARLADLLDQKEVTG